MEARVHQFRGGWAVTGDGFATFAATKEDAIRQFRQHMAAIPSETDGQGSDALLEGMGICLAHDSSRTARTGVVIREDVVSSDRTPSSK